MAIQVLAALLAVAVLWQPILLGLAAFMTAGSPLEKADFIVPLYRDSDATSAAVADLYRRGLAPRVLLYRTAPGRLEKLGLVEPAHVTWQKLLQARGVPAEAIQELEAPVRTDRQLGEALKQLAQGSQRMRVIAAAFGPGSRLTRNALRQGLGDANVDLLIHPVTPRNIDQKAWWRSRAGWMTYFDAYCLWLLGFFR